MDFSQMQQLANIQPAPATSKQKVEMAEEQLMGVYNMVNETKIQHTSSYLNVYTKLATDLYVRNIPKDESFVLAEEFTFDLIGKIKDLESKVLDTFVTPEYFVDAIKGAEANLDAAIKEHNESLESPSSPPKDDSKVSNLFTNGTRQ